MIGRRGSAPEPPPDDQAPWWDAIESHVRRSVRNLEHTPPPPHWGTGHLPGQDGLYGLTAYRADRVWLFVSFGLTELFAKDSADLDVSGWGIELTMRVPRTVGAPPPEWAVAVLGQLGRYVFTTATLEDGHRMPMGRLPAAAPGVMLTGLAFTIDPELGSIRTPHGRVTFLTAVGVTSAELDRMRATTTASVLDDLRAHSPLLVTGMRPQHPAG